MIIQPKPQDASWKGTAFVMACAVVAQLAGGDEPPAGEWQGVLCAWELCAGLVPSVTGALCSYRQQLEAAATLIQCQHFCCVK